MTKRKEPQEPELLRSIDLRGWMPLAQAHRLLALRLGNAHLAALDLTDALERDEIRCMRRSLVNGGWQAAPAGFWSVHELRSFSGGLLVTRRRDPRDTLPSYFIEPLLDWIFYLWLTDLEKRWPLEEAKDKLQRRHGGGPKSNPNDRARVVRYHRANGVSLKETVQWTVTEAAAGRLKKPVAERTLSRWLHETP